MYRYLYIVKLTYIAIGMCMRRTWWKKYGFHDVVALFLSKKKKKKAANRVARAGHVTRSPAIS